MRVLWRVPSLSRDSFVASLADALGTGLLAGAVQPFAGVLARRLGANAELLTVLSMAPFIGFLFAVPASRLVYLYRWGTLLAVARMLIRIPFLFFFWISQPALFVGFLVWSSAVDGATKPLYESLTRAHIRVSVRPALFKWVRIINIAVSLPVAWFTGKLLDRSPDSYRWAFPAAGLLAILLVLPLSNLPRRFLEGFVRHTRINVLTELRVLAVDRRFRLFMLIFFIGTFGEKLLMPVTPIYFSDILNLRYTQVGMATGLVGPVCGIAGFLFWGWRMTKVPTLNIVILCMFLKAVKPAIWALAFRHPDPVLCVVAGEGAFRFIIAGMEMSASLMVLQMAPSGRVPVYVGLHYLFMGVRGLAGPLVGLWLYRSGVGIQNIYWLTAGVVTAGGLALVLARDALRGDARPPADGQFPITPPRGVSG
ncbi:MAG: MFS transporter [Lentisphaerae bacterium]|nr:MFS transporter [Lentisphaerota bacterium]